MKVPPVVQKVLKKKLYLAILIAALVIIIFVGGAITTALVIKSQKPVDKVTLARQETQELLSRVSRLITVPSEYPVVATVKDKSKLTDPFFTDAQNGDKVLIFNKAKKAILYRPSTDKIINAAVSTFAVPTPAKETAQAKIAILNGTKVVGVAGGFEKLVSSSGSAVTVVEKANAVNDYKESVVVIQNPAFKTVADNLMKIYNLKAGSLQDGESTYTEDLVVVLGEDYVNSHK
ncbi:MAG: LytR C-terminal domain-containing protein [Candidatus Levyibacteriota bacterium]